jgi:glycosyltransferase involved in cell wall biosynthesis
VKSIVMLCTAAPGGMAEVVASLRRSGLFARYPTRVLVTHRRTHLAGRLALAAGALAQLAWLLAAGRVALVHAHVAMRGSFWRKALFLALGRAFGVPTVVHLHGSTFVEFYERECGPLRRRLVRATLERATAVIALSESWRAYLARIVPAARVVVIPNMVDAAAVQASIAQSGAERSSSGILFLGEIGRRKGIYDLVCALAQVAAAHPQVRLVAGGSGELEEVRRLARELGVERHLELPGWVAGEAKARLLAEAAIYVLPSHNENLPVSILEAMAAGLPVVSTRVGGIPDAVRHGTEGLLIAPGAREELAQCLLRLLQDSGLARSLGERGRRRVAAEFSPAAVLAALERLYGAICGPSTAATASPAGTEKPARPRRRTTA